MTPNTVSELLELNQSENDKWDDLSNLLEDFNPVETLEVVQLLTQKLATFHFEVVKNRGEEMENEERFLWIHDGTILGQMLSLMNNLSDFQNNDEEE